MPAYSPINMPEIEILFHYNPGNAPSWDDPGCPEEVEYIGLTVNGSDVSQELEEALFEKYGLKWDKEIKKGADK